MAPSSIFCISAKTSAAPIHTQQQTTRHQREVPCSNSRAHSVRSQVASHHLTGCRCPLSSSLALRARHRAVHRAAAALPARAAPRMGVRARARLHARALSDIGGAHCGAVNWRAVTRGTPRSGVVWPLLSRSWPRHWVPYPRVHARQPPRAPLRPCAGERAPRKHGIVRLMEVALIAAL